MKKRILWIDVAKGLAIIFVIWGHTSSNETINRAIYLFHMPLFFMLSGYTMKIPEGEEAIKNEVKKYLKRLLVPYLIISGLFISYFLLKKNTFEEFFYVLPRKIPTVLWGRSGAYFNEEDVPISIYDGVGRCWFLMTLFSARILFLGTKKFLKRMGVCGVLKELIVFCCIALIGIYVGKNTQGLLFDMDIAFVAILFLWIGNNLDIIIPNTTNKVVGMLLVCLLVFTICFYFGANMHMDRGEYSPVCICLIAAITGSIFVIILSKIICASNWINNLLGFVGKNSMQIYCIHCLDDLITWKELPLLLNTTVEYPTVFVVLLRLLACLMIASLGGIHNSNFNTNTIRKS